MFAWSYHLILSFGYSWKLPWSNHLVTVKLKLISCLNSPNKVLLIDNYFPSPKMTTRNKRKLAALNKENYEDNPRSNLAQNSGAPRSQEDYITQVSEEIEGRVTKRLSNGEPHSWCSSAARWLSDETVITGTLRNHSGAHPERIT